MKKLKNSSEESRDRLSELPDSIIFEIFWLMRMREVVQTTILSKRWKNLWTTAPHLNFSWQDSKFVNTTLILWRGFRILKFKFGSWGEFIKKSEFSEIDSWVRLAKENRVEELYLDNMYTCNSYEDVDDHSPEELYSVPHNLYSCSSLKVLLLKGCVLQVSGNVQWNQLRSLTIEGVYLDEHLINQIVSGSPQLEAFILKLLDNDENLSIRSSSLRKLSIEKCLYCIYDDPSTVAEMRIWSPNLETLEMLGVPYQICLLMNVSSLTDLNLGFYFNHEHLYKSPLFEGTDFIGETLGQIIPTIQHVEKVTLSDWCIKGLGALKEKSLLSPWSNLKSLTIYKRYAEYHQIVDLLQISPNIQMLVFQSVYNSNDHFFHAILGDERNLPKSFLHQLRTVEITTVQHPDTKHGDNLIVPFVEIVLKHARNLQKMVILVEGLESWSIPMHLFSELQELLRNAKILADSRVYFVEC